MRAPCGRTIWSRLWLELPRKRPSPLPPLDAAPEPKMENEPDVAGVPDVEDELDSARERL